MLWGYFRNFGMGIKNQTQLELTDAYVFTLCTQNLLSNKPITIAQPKINVIRISKVTYEDLMSL